MMQWHLFFFNGKKKSQKGVIKKNVNGENKNMKLNKEREREKGRVEIII